MEFVNLSNLPLNQVPLELTLDKSKEKFRKLIERYWERDESKFIHGVLDLRKEGGYENINPHFFDNTARIPFDEVCSICGEERTGSFTNRNFFISSLAEYSVSINLKVCTSCLWRGQLLPFNIYKQELKHFKRTGSLERLNRIITSKQEPNSIEYISNVPESESKYPWESDLQFIVSRIQTLTDRLSESEKKQVEQKAEIDILENKQVEQKAEIDILEKGIALKIAQVELLKKDNARLFNVLSATQKREYFRRNREIKSSKKTSLETLKSQLINLDSNVRLRKIVNAPKLKLSIDTTQFNCDETLINKLKDEISLFFNEDVPDITVAGDSLSLIVNSLPKANAVIKIFSSKYGEVRMEDLS